MSLYIRLGMYEILIIAFLNHHSRSILGMCSSGNCTAGVLM